MSSRSTCRPLRLSRLFVVAALFAIALTYVVRSLGAEFEFFVAKSVATDRNEAIAHLSRARTLYPYDHNIRASMAYFYTAFRFTDRTREAITAIDDELKVSPYTADLWVALAAYKIAAGDDAGAESALKRVQALRPGTTIVRE